LSSIPANATITSATLSLWTAVDYSDNNRTIRVYRLKVPFNEMQATWNEAATGVNWQSGGASGANDRESIEIGSVQVLADEAIGIEKQISLSPAKIQEFVNGSFPNNGFILVADTELNDRFNYKSSDASVAANHPKLVVQYTLSSQTPTATPAVTNTPTPGPSATPTVTSTSTFTPTATPPSVPSSVNATFVYDGDGRRVAQTINNVTTYFVGNYYEVTGSTVTKYYYAGAQRVAMRQGTTLYYLLSDHLGSTSLTTDASGNVLSEMRYTAWGEVRYNSGVIPTQYQYTGQYSYTNSFGLMYYHARWLDVSLGRFAQADSIVPGGVQGYDRYAYVQNNPLLFVDPSGHCGIETNKDGKETVGKLDCKAKDIAGWSMTYRLRWFKLLTATAGASRWFHNIEGILEVFDKHNLGETVSGGANDWISWTDAGLLESIQNGYTGATEGAAGKWNTFFGAVEAKKDGALLKQLWGQAEMAGTAYGSDLAEGMGYSGPDWSSDPRGKFFLEIGNRYRELTSLPYGGEIVGAGFVGLGGGYAGFRVCGALCAVGGVLVGGAGGGYVGGWATYPGSDIWGHHIVYYVADAILGSK